MVRRRDPLERPEGSLEVAGRSYLADTSALARLRHASVAERLGGLIVEGKVVSCGVVDLELLFSARGPAEIAAARSRRETALPSLEMSQLDFDRAGEVLEELARRGRHRAAGIADLLIAARAERDDVILLHYDSDFDTIAAVTGQPVEWVVQRGSVP